MATETVIEMKTITCYGCLGQMKPNETDWELFMSGIHVHGNDDCRDKFSQRVIAYNDTREPFVNIEVN